MAFGSLLGGLMTQIGTSPNIVVSRVREELTGESFQMFDFTPVGAALAAVGLVFLTLFYWLVPARRRDTGSLHEALDIANYITEAEVVAGSAVRGEPVGGLTTEESDPGLDALPLGDHGAVCRRLDAKHRDSSSLEVLKQIPVVACDFDYLGSQSHVKSTSHLLAIRIRVSQPGIGVRRKVRVVVHEDPIGRLELRQLHEPAGFADHRLQGKEHLPSGKLVGIHVRVRKR